MAIYPAIIPTNTDYPNRTDDVHWVYAARYNEIKNEVIAICAELGISPSGASATVVARLALLALKSNVLELDNTTPFTPDADYEPATKKYHDDNSIANVVEDTTPELGGEMDAGEHSVGFTEKANVVAANAVTIDWKDSNKQKLTVDANVTVTFTAPSNPCSLILRIIQSGAGHTTTLPTLKTVGGETITISNTDGAIDIVALYYDGTSYYAMAGLLFS